MFKTFRDVQVQIKTFLVSTENENVVTRVFKVIYFNNSRYLQG